MSPIELAIFVSRVESICQEMGVVLRQAAFSPNIKDRLDFSCALFDASGELFSQAAHIPVHLGSMAYAMRDIVTGVDWQVGDILALNDPFLGGTHLPDVTLVSPFFIDDELLGFIANRAHHANIGASSPGSMPISTTLEEEGMIIPPTLLVQAGSVVVKEMEKLGGLQGADVSGDFAAQMSANRVGVDRLSKLVRKMGTGRFANGINEINAYGERLAKAGLKSIPKGRYVFSDLMDDDGYGTQDVKINVTIDIEDDRIKVDFEGTSPQVKGNINCPLSVAAAAVFYCFRCLLPENTPACAGVFRFIDLHAPVGSLVNATRPAATAAGNVETSMRIVDAVLGALSAAIPDRIPAASQGTMNNVAMGNHKSNQPWDYYETIAGGSGANAGSAGASAVQSHMTNTLNTPIESLEMHYPLRIRSYTIRRGSGGKGRYRGGDGLIREFEFLEPAEVTLITERRRHAPWPLDGGNHGETGKNSLDGKALPGKCHIYVKAGQVLKVETPGGGGFGRSLF
ncbi:MAG: hydantoinase B/oxoprolinase family protein [Gammaproteobacteria bacterium]|nr:hydantoinase B/oxoprolinase family protein [Gammaproteobacteria bacterium]